MAVKVIIMIFSVMTPYNLVTVNEHFREHTATTSSILEMFVYSENLFSCVIAKFVILNNTIGILLVLCGCES